MINEITVPREIVNDDMVTIVSWLFAAGDRVGPQNVVVSIETSKAVIDVESEVEGYLEILRPEGAEVAIGELIGRVRDQPAAEQPDEGLSGSFETDAEAAGVSFSRKAREALVVHRLDPELFMGRGLVREEDVLAYVHRQGTNDLESNKYRDATDADEDKEGDGLTKHRVGLWRDAQMAASARSRGMLWLAFNYFWRTWLLSNLVRWMPRFAILTLHRWRGIEVGRGCFIDPSAIMETAHPGNICVGDDVRVAANVVIMTHIKPPHFLRNHSIMDSRLAPVVLEDSCFIGVSAVIMPGVRVGQAAVVASGAVVVGDVPPFAMVAGNPAKVDKRFIRPDDY